MWNWVDTALLAFNSLLLALNLAAGAYLAAAFSGIAITVLALTWAVSE